MNVKHGSILLRDAVDFAWKTFKYHNRLMMAILLTIFGAWIILEIIVIVGQRFGLVWWTVAHLAFLFVFAGLEAGFVKTCLALYDGEERTFADACASFSLGSKFLAGQILYLLMVLVGLVLFIIPGLHVGARYAFIGLLQVGEQSSLSGSFRGSALLSREHMPSLMGVIGALLLFNLIGACLLGIGLLITIPLSVLTMTGVYKQVRALSVSQ